MAHAGHTHDSTAHRACEYLCCFICLERLNTRTYMYDNARLCKYPCNHCNLGLKRMLLFFFIGVVSESIQPISGSGGSTFSVA